MRPVESIARLKAPALARFERDFASVCRPVILTGAIDSWPAMSRWTFSWFAERHGAHRVPVHRRTGSRVDEVEIERMTLAHYFEHMRDASQRLHFAGHCLLQELPELWRDISVPQYVDRIDDDQPFIFFSPAGNVTPLHRDICHNFYAVVRGVKRFVLFTPRQRSLLHAPPVWHRSSWTSPIDVDSPDYARYPRARNARPLEAVLEAGEVLFIPGGYWHTVRTIEESVAVAFFWEHGLRQRTVRTFLRVMGRPAT